MIEVVPSLPFRDLPEAFSLRMIVHPGLVGWSGPGLANCIARARLPYRPLLAVYGLRAEEKAAPFVAHFMRLPR